MSDDFILNFKAGDILLTQDFLNFYPQFSRVWVFKLINQAIDEQRLVKIDKGIYFVPDEKGLLKPSLYDVIDKLYIFDENKNRIGFYSSDFLFDYFGLLTDENITNKIDVVTNNEHTPGRTIRLLDDDIYIRMPRVKLTNENIYMYIIFELFNRLPYYFYAENRERCNEKLISYINEHDLLVDDLLPLFAGDIFPKSTLKNIQKSDLLKFLAKNQDKYTFAKANKKKVEEMKFFFED